MIAVYEIQDRVVVDASNDLIQRVRIEGVIVVEQSHELTARQRQRMIHCPTEPHVFRQVLRLDPLVRSCEIVEQAAYVSRRRPVVDDAKLPIRVDLPPYRLDGAS